MIPTKFLFLIGRGKDLFIRNLSLHLVSMITIATVLFVFNLFLIIGYSADSFISSLSNIQTVRVYLNTSEKEAIENLKSQILEINAIDEVKYYSSQETYNYLKDSQMNQKYLKIIPQEFFPDFMEVTVNEKYRDIKYIKDIETQLSEFKAVDVASFGESWILNFISFRYGIHFFLTILAILLSLAMCSIIYNTIKISLFRYRDEIQIYNLVGATRSFIIVPFLLTVMLEITISFGIAMFSGIVIFNLMNKMILESINIEFLIIPHYLIYIICYAVIATISLSAGLFSVNSFLHRMGTINES